MDKKELYRLVEEQTIKAGKTLEDKCIEELQELSAEMLVCFSDVKNRDEISNYLELSDEIADFIITLEQVSKKEFYNLVRDRFEFKLCRLGSRLQNGELFK